MIMSRVVKDHVDVCLEQGESCNVVVMIRNGRIKRIIESCIVADEFGDLC